MAWNQPGDDKRRPAQRGAPDNASLDQLLRRWQQRVQRLWRPGSSRGKAAAVLVLLAAAVWLASGYYQIGSAERGVVQRFGAYVSTELPGGGWHWPWPIETLTKVNVASVQSVDGKAMVLSADQSLIDLSWSVQYHISDPLQYLFGLRDPQMTLRQTSQAVIRELAARDELQSLLGGEARARLSGAARARIQQMLQQYGAGIELSSLTLTDVGLPDPVVAAQHEAEHATQARAQTIGDAQTYASETDLKARGAAQQQISAAQVYATQTVASAQADAARFTQLAKAYALSPQVMRDRLYIQTIGGILAHSRKIFIDAKSGNGTMIYLPLDQLLQAKHSTPPPESSPAAAAQSSTSSGPPSRPQRNDDRSRDRGDR
ncbi:MAG: FtsH protease activity modulator HflK [Steroidobacteraceae bacterium]